MSERYLKFIETVAHGGPIHIAGYSLGGLVAVEMARRRKNVGVVGVLDTFASGYPVRLPFKDRLKIHLNTVLFAGWERKKRYVAKRINNINERIHFALGRPYIHPEERRGTEEIIPEAVFWAHRHACAVHAFEPFDGEIHALQSRDVPPDWPGNDFSSDPTMGLEPLREAGHDLPHSWTRIGPAIQERQIERLAQALE